MKIGFLSGDLVEVNNQRAGVSVPDYPVQGRLMDLWVKGGHEVTLFTRYPKTDTLPEGVVDAVGSDPREHDLDIMFGDRLGVYGSEWEVTVTQLEQYSGPIIYHQYVPYSHWAPPFKEMPHLGGGSKQWLILNRSVDPLRCYNALVGQKERLSSYGHIQFARWEPFYMLDYPFNGKKTAPLGGREYTLGYYGRLPQGEKRAKTVEKWMQIGEWPKVVYGPETSTKWISEATGATNGGRVLHRELPEAITKFDVIVQAAIDRLRNKGRFDFWPHRVVECAIAGTFQLFDVEMDLIPFRRWQVTRPSDLIRWIDAVEDPVVLREQVAAQRAIIFPRADPTEVHSRLMKLMKEHAC